MRNLFQRRYDGVEERGDRGNARQAPLGDPGGDAAAEAAGALSASGQKRSEM